MSINKHSIAVLQALLVTFLWSTSWVLIKIGLTDIPALTFAGLRYLLAFLCLLPFALRQDKRAMLKRLSGKQWALLLLLGLFFYAIVQGAQFLGLVYLSAATVSLILNFTSIVVAIMGILWLREMPGLGAWIGILLSMLGGILFFYPVELLSSQLIGILIVVIGMIINAGSSVLGRYINHHENIHPLIVTTVSMGAGSLVLIFTGALTQGIPHLSINNWLIIIWLAVINTAFAFTLWNHTLRTLKAMQSSIINGTMLIQIALLAWLILDENLSVQNWLGLLIAGLGVILVQLYSAKSAP